MGAYLEREGKTPAKGGADSIVLAAYEKDVPIFCPAFSDCSAGFGLVAHQHARQGKPMVSIDSAKDFYELTQLKIHNPHHGIAHDRRRRSKNFAQDIVVAADILGSEAPMHKYAIQITVGDRGASIRLPMGFIKNGYRGYMEDRRPNSMGDPYQIASQILKTISEVPLGESASVAA